MLKLVIPTVEYFDDVTEEFFTIEGGTLTLEHSLLSISKWEQKWHKSYLATDDKTADEIMDYIQCMIVNPNVDVKMLNNLTQQNIDDITKYINDPMTATVIHDGNKSKKKEIITNEQIYSWMIQLNIPVEFQKWHLNRLLTLIRVCQIRNEPQKKMGRREQFEQQRALNAQRRAQMHSKG